MFPAIHSIIPAFAVKSMRLSLLILGLVLSFGRICGAQTPEFDNLKRLAALKIHTSSGSLQGAWVQQRDSTIVLQDEGIRRTIPLISIDSAQQFVTNGRVNRKATIAGAVLGAVALSAVGYALCDYYQCAQGTIALAGIGALIGGVVGRTVGGVATSITGEWVTFYRRM